MSNVVRVFYKMGFGKFLLVLKIIIYRHKNLKMTSNLP